MGLKIGKYEVSALCYRTYRIYLRRKCYYESDKQTKSQIERRIEEALDIYKKYGLSDVRALLCAEDRIDAEDYNKEKGGELE